MLLSNYYLSGELKLVLWVQTSPRSKMMLSYKCFPHVSKMPIFTYNQTNSVIIKKAIILNIIHNIRYENIDEVEKHSHQVATKFLSTILNVLLNEKKYISMHDH
jgi:hypothetical protein